MLGVVTTEDRASASRHLDVLGVHAFLSIQEGQRCQALRARKGAARGAAASRALTQAPLRDHTMVVVNGFPVKNRLVA